MNVVKRMKVTLRGGMMRIEVARTSRRDSYVLLLCCIGFFRTRITESPRRNILEMNRSLFTGLDFFLPFPAFGFSVHISLTSTRTMLQCRSKALTRPKSRRLFRQLMRICVLYFTAWVRTDRGPVWNSSSPSWARSPSRSPRRSSLEDAILSLLQSFSPGL